MAAKKTKKAPKPLVQAIAEEPYSVAIKVNGSVIRVSGETVEAAILKIPSFMPKTVGTISVTHDGKTGRDIMLKIPALRRLFFPGMTGNIQRIALAKRAALYK